MPRGRRKKGLFGSLNTGSFFPKMNMAKMTGIDAKSMGIPSFKRKRRRKFGSWASIKKTLRDV
jgi:hypothetical protein